MLGLGLSIPQLATRGGRTLTLSQQVAALFANGAQGVWYDPSDYSTLYQDAAGTTPITTPLEKPVGLMLDKSKGLVLGSELVTNGDFSNGTTGWSPNVDATLAAESGKLKQTINGVQGYCNSYQTISVTSGRLYKVTLSIEAGTSTSRFIRVGTAIASSAYGEYSAIGTTTFSFWATGSTLVITPTVAGSNGAYAYFSNISVKELPGNHAYQSTTTSRPTLSARYNLLTKTEQFDDAVWQLTGTLTLSANDAVAPDGTITADKYNITALNPSAEAGKSQSFTCIATTYRVSWHVKAGTITAARIGMYDGTDYGTRDFTFATKTFDNPRGALVVSSTSYQELPDGWFRLSATITATHSSAAANVAVYMPSLGTCWVWGADIRVANDGIGLPAYQRVNTATDYDYAGFPPYLKFDGTDDSMATGNINFTATDKMTVFAGVRKLSDAAPGVIVELAAAQSVTGSISLIAREYASGDYALDLRGTSGYTWQNYSGFDAPITNVLTAQYDQSGTTIGQELSFRANGSPATLGITSGGPNGNTVMANAPLYIGRRGGTTLPYNGRLYSLVVCGKLASAAEIASTEAYINQKTRAY